MKLIPYLLKYLKDTLLSVFKTGILLSGFYQELQDTDSKRATSTL